MTPEEKIEVLDRSVKVLGGECDRCGGKIKEYSGLDRRYVQCLECEKHQGADTFGEAYILFFIVK